MKGVGGKKFSDTFQIPPFGELESGRRHVGMRGMAEKLDRDGLAIGARFLSFLFAVFFSSSNLHF